MLVLLTCLRTVSALGCSRVLIVSGPLHATLRFEVIFERTPVLRGVTEQQVLENRSEKFSPRHEKAQKPTTAAQVKVKKDAHVQGTLHAKINVWIHTSAKAQPKTTTKTNLKFNVKAEAKVKSHVQVRVKNI